MAYEYEDDTFFDDYDDANLESVSFVNNNNNQNQVVNPFSGSERDDEPSSSNNNRYRNSSSSRRSSRGGARYMKQTMYDDDDDDENFYAHSDEDDFEYNDEYGVARPPPSSYSSRRRKTSSSGGRRSTTVVSRRNNRGNGNGNRRYYDRDDSQFISMNTCKLFGLITVLVAAIFTLANPNAFNNNNNKNNSIEESSASAADNSKVEDENTNKQQQQQQQHVSTKKEAVRGPFVYPHLVDPFMMESSSPETQFYGSIFTPPHQIPFNDDENKNRSPPPLGYMTQPSLFNNTLAFTSEGNLYVSTISLDDNKVPHHFNTAAKITNVVGNVLTPKINPKYPYLIAFTATYTGWRELYLMDLRYDIRMPSQRLTYSPTSHGIAHVIGWSDDGTSIIFSGAKREVGIEDTKLYKVAVSAATGGATGKANDDDKKKSKNENKDNESNATKAWKKNNPDLRHMISSSSSLSEFVTVGSIQSMPLAQAVDAVEYNKCLYFIRHKQSSNTFRYVGGTAESLWGYCDDGSEKNEEFAVKILEYAGTTKSPKVYKEKYLLFISDGLYDDKTETIIPATLELQAIPLPKRKDMYTKDQRIQKEKGGGVILMDQSSNNAKPIRITSISCDNDGKQLMEFDIDAVTGNIILRVGADFQILDGDEVSSMLKKAFKKDNKTRKLSSSSSSSIQAKPLPIALYSDFHLQHERLIPLTLPLDIDSIDVFSTIYHQTYALLGMRGQSFVSPVIPKEYAQYRGINMIPPRGYKFMPSSSLGGITRILAVRYVKPYDKLGDPKALVLATDPLSETAEHALYLLPCDPSIQPFFSLEDIPIPILGGHLSTGGSIQDGGLGSIYARSLEVSPCGRRAAWVDTDGKVSVMSIPKKEGDVPQRLILPPKNNMGEPLVGTDIEVSWSPGGRYLAMEHGAKNQFSIISVADLGDPENPTGEEEKNEENNDDDDNKDDDENKPKFDLKRIIQATPARFNSGDVFWGRSAQNFAIHASSDETGDHPSTTLYFLTDRDIASDVNSPWGTRAPQPHLKKHWVVYALPLKAIEEPDEDDDEEKEELSLFEIDIDERLSAPYPNGGAAELLPIREALMMGIVREELALLLHDNNDTTNSSSLEELNNNATDANSTKDANNNNNVTEDTAGAEVAMDILSKLSAPPLPDITIDFGESDNDSLDTFARYAYRVDSIPAGPYLGILCQLSDNPSFILLEKGSTKLAMAKFFPISKPTIYSDISAEDPVPFSMPMLGAGISTSRKHIYFYTLEGLQVITNTLEAVMSTALQTEVKQNLVDESNLVASIYPRLEYQQMFADAWRMLRDYFYDPGMHGVNWLEVFHRYKPLVSRCAKREELDDVLSQMASELSALHVFVYGGEYGDPLHGSKVQKEINAIASLGITSLRSEEKGGYVVQDVHTGDPDFAVKDGRNTYSPLSEKVLRLSGQKGLQQGDVITAINGEHVLGVPDMHMLLRGKAGNTVRLDIQREGSNYSSPLIAVPISAEEAQDLSYSSWEHRTRLKAVDLAKDAGFTVGYIHLRDMSGPDAMNEFTRYFYPDYDKEAFIIDVRHNHGGNIDSWLLTLLQRRAWAYWQSRSNNVTNGGLGWDEQFAFRGHIVVLVDEKTSSDGEGFTRGVMELGLGKSVGTRTWGGGIWLSSDNHLVDGGIATAPEIGEYNGNFGWGMGIENMGVTPDYIVDNDPRQVELGNDMQLVKAIEILKNWLDDEPVVFPAVPKEYPNMSYNSKCESKP